MNSLRRQSGMVLILSILIVGTVLAAAAAFTALIVRDIQQSRLVDQSIQSGYLAESGAERALYQVRHREAIKPADCASVALGSVCQEATGYCSGTNNQVPCITSSRGSLALRGNWNTDVSNEQVTTVALNPDEGFQIDLFNPYQSQVSNITKITTFRIESNLTQTYDLYGEITNLSWLAGGNSLCANTSLPASAAISKGQITLTVHPGDTTASTDYIKNFVIPYDITYNPVINRDCSYSLRISNSLPNKTRGTFSISIYDTAAPADPVNDRLPIPSRLVIDSSATYGSSYQKIEVRTPMRPTLSGLYDFVLFSEQEITK